MNLYKCTHCNKILKRNSNKKWIPSICSSVGKRVRLQLINQNKNAKTDTTDLDVVDDPKDTEKK